MPRKGPALRREVPVDPIYKSVLVTQLTNKILERGKRTIAERIVYTALEQVEQKTGTDPVATLSAPWRTFDRSWKSRAAASGVPPTKCQWRFDRVAPLHWLSAG